MQVSEREWGGYHGQLCTGGGNGAAGEPEEGDGEHIEVKEALQERFKLVDCL